MELIPLLTEALNDGSYKIGQSTSFVITRPKFREVWAADFIDRVVHHVVLGRIQHQFQKQFIQDSYACIAGRGSLYGTYRIHKKLRQATENWTKPAYYLQADIANFFVSIDKNILADLILPYIDDLHVRELTRQLIWHDPTEDFKKNSPQRLYTQVPQHKSLLKCPYWKGLPIGNLSSQFFANVYMNLLDQFIKRVLKIEHYGRYVDDIILIGDNPQELNEAFKKIEEFATKKLGIKFHPNKTNRNTADKGIDFCGYILLPYRRYTRVRTVNSLKEVLRGTDKKGGLWGSCVNSYLGITSHSNSYNFRKSLVEEFKVPLECNYSKTLLKRFPK